MQCLQMPILRPSRLLCGRTCARLQPTITLAQQTIPACRSFRTAPRPLPLHTRNFHTTRTLLKRKKVKAKSDIRIKLIRYHFRHPLNPRPLRFSRNRSLRHWTIHRAYQLFRSKQRQARELELERQFSSMRDACEALRLTGENGLSISGSANVLPPPGARDPPSVTFERTPGNAGTAESINVGLFAERQKEIGKLYRIAMLKDGIFDGVPIEYARAQTDTPPKNGWDHTWTR